MAYDYKNLPVLSKVKIGEQIYYLKDAELRALVDTFGDAVNYSVDKDVLTVDGNLATVKAIKAYVDDAVKGLAGAMHFVGVKTEEEFAAGVTGSNGDVIIVGTAEYVYSDGEWKLIGDEGVYATKAGVEAAYVKKTLTIAGIDHADDITKEELITALGLKALAFKDEASGSISTADSVADAQYTPAGSVAVELNQTATTMSSTGNFKPAGTVAGTTTAAGSVSIAKSEAGTQISGTVSAPTITVTPATVSVQHLDSVGTLPKYTAAEYVAPSVAETNAQFAQDGMLASIDESDAEMLVFGNANKAAALTGTGFNAGSYTAATYEAGTLPVLGEAQNVLTGVSAVASEPVFTGDKFGATFAGSEATINATFSGTEAAVEVSGNYDKATFKAATFTGTEATISHELVKTAKTITV
jgi:hypothetical protein